MSTSLARRLGGFVTAAVIAAVAAVPAPALGLGGATTIALNGPAASSLRQAGISVSPLKPAKGGPRQIVLPVAAGLAGSRTTLLRHRGGIELRGSGGKALRMTKLRLLLGKRSRVSAKLGGRQVDVFRVTGPRRIDPTVGSVEASGMRVTLTRAGAAAIADRLLPPPAPRKSAARSSRDVGLRPGFFGKLSTRVSGLVAAGAAPAPGTQAQKASGCPLPSGAGPTAPDPPPLATRPAAAVDVVAASIGWHVRESFIRYIGSGEGTSVSGGATADPPVLLSGASVPLSYDFHFPFTSGWHDGGADPANPGDDVATIRFGGAVRFHYSAHEIDLTTGEPEIEIAGGSSRAIFAIAEGSDPAQRQVLVNLDLGRAGAVVANGSTYTYERVPGAIPAGTANSVFAGFYSPGTDFGCFDLSYTTG